MVWVSPPNLLTISLIKIKSIRINGIRGRDIIIKMGAIFCQVDRIKQFFHERDCMTDGNQKW